MRFETSGELRRLDLTSIVDLLPALQDEWADLQFAPGGSVLNPLTGGTAAAVALVRGRHRQAGAVYWITVSSPKLELPEDRRGEFEKEARELTRGRANHEQWADHVARRRAASVQVGREQERFSVTLREDSARKLSFTVSEEPTTWTVDVDVEHRRLPKVGLNGRIDLTAAMKADGMPGCLTALLGGTGGGQAVVDLAVLERGGELVRAGGRANRFRADARVDIQLSTTTWTVAGCGSVRARGLGRPVLWLAGRRIRRSVGRALAEFWASGGAQALEWENQLSQLGTAIEIEGGPAPFIRRLLWDEDFDPGIGSLRQTTP